MAFDQTILTHLLILTFRFIEISTPFWTDLKQSRNNYRLYKQENKNTGMHLFGLHQIFLRMVVIIIVYQLMHRSLFFYIVDFLWNDRLSCHSFFGFFLSFLYCEICTFSCGCHNHSWWSPHQQQQEKGNIQVSSCAITREGKFFSWCGRDLIVFGLS